MPKAKSRVIKQVVGPPTCIQVQSARAVGNLAPMLSGLQITGPDILLFDKSQCLHSIYGESRRHSFCVFLILNVNGLRYMLDCC
jgi:hypothetical protein